MNGDGRIRKFMTTHIAHDMPLWSTPRRWAKTGIEGGKRTDKFGFFFGKDGGATTSEMGLD